MSPAFRRKHFSVRNYRKRGYGGGTLGPVLDAAKRRAIGRLNAAPRYARFRGGARLLNARTGGFLGLELKYLDSALVGVALPAPANCTGGEMDPAGTGCTGCISCPAQGDTQSSRDGLKFIIKSAHISGHVDSAGQATQSGTLTPPVVFVAMVLDTQTNGAQLNSEDVYTSVGADARLNGHPVRNLQHIDRFKVLDSKSFIVPTVSIQDAATTAYIDLQSRSFELDWSGNIEVQTTGTTANVSSVANNSIHVIAWVTSASTVPLLTYNARVRFMG